MNYRLLSLLVIVFYCLVKVFSFYWIFLVISCLTVAILAIFSVILSASPEQTIKAILRNPLEQPQTKIRFGIDGTLLFEIFSRFYYC